MVLTQDIGSTTGHELSQMLLFHESETLIFLMPLDSG